MSAGPPRCAGAVACPPPLPRRATRLDRAQFSLTLRPAHASSLLRPGSCGGQLAEEWEGEGDVGRFLSRVRRHCLGTRKLLREISKRADTPIEPPEQVAARGSRRECR